MPILLGLQGVSVIVLGSADIGLATLGGPVAPLLVGVGTCALVIGAIAVILAAIWER